jgi:hypothetical protein
VLVRVVFVVGIGVDDVEAVAFSATGEGDVAGFAVEAVVPEDEGLVEGGPLSLVDGDGLAVIEVSSGQVAARQPQSFPAGRLDGESVFPGVDGAPTRPSRSCVPPAKDG